MIFFDQSKIGPWVCEKTGGTWAPGRGQAIGLLKDDKLQAGVLYEDWNGTNIVCHIRGEPGWANRKFLAIIFDYPFNQLKVNRITVPINDDNSKSIRLVTNMGFKLECQLKEASNIGGDILLYRLFREECKYLTGRYHGKI